jgi:acyl transferase domain-containing protein/NADPH:quinone reductase-like Zn-dependent oxidoreductase/acyl carrier protein
MPNRIAVIGYAFRLPDTSRERFWPDLLEGRNLVTSVPPDRWGLDAFTHPLKDHPGTSYTFQAGSIGDVSLFDAGFFGISPREAALMDPQQRLVLELGWETLENAGVVPSSLRGGGCGVYLGISAVDYAYRFAEDLGIVDSFVATGNACSIAANRLSYFLDLRGPSMAIDTACSSSLVAFHQACRAILSGECDLALTGGVSLHLHPYGFLTFSKASMLSRNGRCRVFDAACDGYVRSEGGGLFLLKDLDRAVADGDPIEAIVAASTVNTDGRKSGLTVPSPEAQAALMERTVSLAGIDPAEIDYFEAHGTGTPVGDPIEARAIGVALGARRPRGNPLPVGSIKSNLGHLESAAGVAGMVKALHCLKHRMIPANVGMTAPNPAIPWEELNLDVVTVNTPLKPSGRILVGINSFGFGGANANVLLESFESRPSMTPADRPPETGAPFPLIVSARTAEGLKGAARDMAAFLRDEPRASYYDIAHTSVFRRERFEHRALVSARSAADAAAALADFAEGRDSGAPVVAGTGLAGATGPAFVYSGNGSQWFGMGRQLLGDPVFLDALREVDRLFSGHADWSLEAELSGVNGDRLALTEIAQPTLFAVQVGITCMLRARGIVPAAVGGHSVGEIPAAWAAGALSLPDAVRVIYYRSLLQGQTRGQGQMTAAGLAPQQAEQVLEELGLADGICIAGINSRNGVTLAGPPEVLERVESVLAERNRFRKRLPLDYAFHSPCMDPIEGEVRRTLAGIRPAAPGIRFYSTVTGYRSNGEPLDADYWWRNVRRPVLFRQAVSAMIADGTHLFVEIGPHAVLRGYLEDGLQEAAVPGRVVATGLRNDDSPARIHDAAAQAIIAGAAWDRGGLFPSPGRFVPLPNYPWQRERHWHGVTAESLMQLNRSKFHPLLGYPLARWEQAWENRIDTLLAPVLADHAVGGAVVFPGAAYVELALAAAASTCNADVIEVEDLEILSPLVLGDQRTKTVRTQVNGQDGSLAVTAKTLAKDEPWTLHATARIPKSPSSRPEDEGYTYTPQRAPDFTGPDHYALSRSVGLEYGPAFQAVHRGWVDGDEVHAGLSVPAAVASELDSYLLHPSLLDSAFQLVLHLLADRDPSRHGLVFVPTRVDRMIFRPSSAVPSRAVVRLVRRSAHSLVVDVDLHAEDGVRVASLRKVRFRALPLGKDSDGNRLDQLADAWIPRPHPAAVASPNRLVPLGPLVAGLETAVSDFRSGDAPYRRYVEEVEPLLDTLCRLYGMQALAEYALPGGRIPAETIEAVKRSGGEATRCVDHLVDFLGAEGLLAVEPGGIRLSVDPDGIRPAWDSDEPAAPGELLAVLLRDYPDHAQIIRRVAQAGAAIPDRLRGNGCGVEGLPRGSASADAWPVTLGSAGVNRLSLAFDGPVRSAISRLPEGERLGMLEVGYASPLFLPRLCRARDRDLADYHFCRVGAEGSEELRWQERFPVLRLHQWSDDPGGDPTAGISPRSCHLAVVHADALTRLRARAVLSSVRSVLRPDGLLVLFGQHPPRWMEFLHPPRDEDAGCGEAPVLPRMPAGSLRTILEDLGFADASRLEYSPDTGTGPYLLVARSRAQDAGPSAVQAAASRVWFVLCDGAGNGRCDAISEGLRRMGDRVVVCRDRSEAEISSELKRTVELEGALHGILHCAGTCPADSSNGRCDDLTAVAGRCDGVVALVKACESASITAPIWMVAGDPAMKSGGGSPDLREIAVAALWGMGRTWMNESPQEVRLIGLDSDTLTQPLLEAVLREITLPDAEREVVLTGTGARFVPRLRPVPPAESPAMLPEEGTPSVRRLGVRAPGQLRTLGWEIAPEAPPGDEEVMVRVRATGLNFRDVMFAVGLLPDDALENGFTGPTLGLEFAGEVSAAGSRVKDISPGDRVFGFGPASFSNLVTTSRSAVARIPDGLSYEAAATIPVAFFTAYYSLCHCARLRAGERVLIHGAAGGVGLAAVQIAKWRGAEIHATAGSGEKRGFLRLLGAAEVYDSRSLSFADRILETTGGSGMDVVLNSLSGEAIHQNLRVLKPFGRLLELGKRDYYENTRIGLRPFRNNISYFGIDADQLMKVRPDLTSQLLEEIMDLFAKGVLTPLPYTTFEADDVVSAFRHMQQSGHIGKIVVTYRNGIPAPISPARQSPPSLALEPDDTFLVTGGLGGFGLKTAEWLAVKGCRNLVLVGRSGPATEEAEAAVARMRKAGVTVLAAACDISDRNALSELLAEASRTLPPLRGVVHAAMVIDDALLRAMRRRQIRRVFAPKVAGAVHLHELTRPLGLKYFVLFSSATTLFGNPGQGNYVAANSGMEALARLRRAAGLPATAACFGPIDDVGYLARNPAIKEALQNRMGGRPLTADQAFRALETLLGEDRSGVGVLRLDWHSLGRWLPASSSPRYSELAASAGEGRKNGSDIADVKEQIARLSGPELLEYLVRQVTIEVGEILRIPIERLGADLSLHDLGMDSLMGAELAVALENRFGAKLSAMALGETPTIGAIAEQLASRLKGGGPAGSPENVDSLASHIHRIAVQQGAGDIDGGEIDEFARELAGKTASTN